ncbi:FAD/NAD(P)-binding domain-containing protein [Xylariomycetidae sp. FL2044]|nr:FAD/NAD(P)-binding domain-containing protein [Xylariomycetidae sp. FL2044]
MPPSITPDRPILIIGAGVAGLTLAQGLRLRSVPFRLFERHPRSRSSQGHRFRISRDGQAALNSVLSPHLQDLLQRTAPDANRFQPRYVDAATLSYPDPVPAGSDSLPIDRTWIRALLSREIEDAIEYGKEFVSYEIVDDGVSVRANFADGEGVVGRLLVGADGLRSRVRKQFQPDRKLLDLERWVIWGRTRLDEDQKNILPDHMLSWCMYLDSEANTQAVVEPMTWTNSERRSGIQPAAVLSSECPDYVYWVLCTATSQYSEHLPKTPDEKRLFLRRATEKWHTSLRLLFDSSSLDQTACVPVLSSKPDIELRLADRASAGHITIIGDAAHAMSPMGGSGADTAVSTAADLAELIAVEGVTRDSILAFESRMEARARDKIEHSFRGGQKFWRGKAWDEYPEVDV